MGARRRALVMLVMGGVVLCLPSSAQAATERFVVPSGGSQVDPNCTAIPCELEYAVETVAQNGDTVTLAAGTYNFNGLLSVGGVGKQLLVRGTPGQAHPVINSNDAGGSIAVKVDGGSTFRGIDVVEASSGGFPFAVLIANGTLEQAVATGTGTGAGCGTENATGPVVIRDSVCRHTNGGSGAYFSQNAAGAQTVRVVNATMVGEGAVEPVSGNGAEGIRALTGAAGRTVTVDLSNTIAAGAGFDISETIFGGSISFQIDHSNYLTTRGASIPAAGTGTNQTAAPLFVDAGAANFHQAAGSPTINAGSAGAANLGPADFDGEERCMGTAPDIGADEFTATGCSVDSDGDGVPDVSDTCPSQSGPASNGGCPLPDGDGDGVPDASDTCPTQAGPASNAGCPEGDTDPPQTRIRKTVITDDVATFRFSSDERGSTFKCKLQELKGGGRAGTAKARFRACTSPKRLRNLDKGEYRFSVRATDAAGNNDPTPSRQRFKIAGEGRN